VKIPIRPQFSLKRNSIHFGRGMLFLFVIIVTMSVDVW